MHQPTGLEEEDDAVATQHHKDWLLWAMNRIDELCLLG
jgi:hypothetical protein